jgi:hypothetical protein
MNKVCDLCFLAFGLVVAYGCTFFQTMAVVQHNVR